MTNHKESQMIDPTIRRTFHLPNGDELESEFERRGDQLRLRLRLCRDGFVEAAYRATYNLLDPMCLERSHKEGLQPTCMLYPYLGVGS